MISNGKCTYLKFAGSHFLLLLQWVFNDFIPTYYCMETPMKSLHFNAMIDELNMKKDLYVNVPFIIQYQHFLKSANNYEALKLPKKNIYYNIPMMPNTTSRDP